MKLVEKVGVFFSRAVDYLAIMAIVTFVFVMLSVSADVIMRYFFNRPMIWVSELTEVGLLYICFLSAAWVLKKEGHVEVEALVDRLNPRNRLLAKVITSILGALLCLFVTWYGTLVTLDQFQKGWVTPSILELPIAPIVVIIPVGNFFLFIQFLRRAYSYFGRWKSSRNNGEDS